MYLIGDIYLSLIQGNSYYLWETIDIDFLTFNSYNIRWSLLNQTLDIMYLGFQLWVLKVLNHFVEYIYKSEHVWSILALLIQLGSSQKLRQLIEAIFYRLVHCVTRCDSRIDEPGPLKWFASLHHKLPWATNRVSCREIIKAPSTICTQFINRPVYFPCNIVQ